MTKKILFLGVLVLFQILLNMANAKETERPGVSVERKQIVESKDIVVEIKASKPFVDIQEVKIWNFLEENKEDESIPELQWLAVIVSFISMIIEAVLWLMPLVAIFYLYQYREYWLSLIQGNNKPLKEAALPETLFGLDVRQESLPDDIEKTAQVLWQENHHRDAVSLLYRASLVVLIKKYRFELSAGATEEDCIRKLVLIEKQYSSEINNKNNILIAEKRIKLFKKLTKIWIAIAYAHKKPDEADFNLVCQNWAQYFINDKAVD